MEQLKTINDYIQWAANEFLKDDLFFGHGTDNALDEAIILIIGALNLSFGQLDTHLNHALTQQEKNKVQKIVELRKTKKCPVAYIIKKAWFAGLEFYVDERVIVPRSPFAELILDEFQPWIGNLELKNILDMCTGGACIAIACAHQFPQVQVDAVDYSKEALEVAKINVDNHCHLQNRINLIHSNLFDQVPNEKYDLIVTNPPYVSFNQYEQLPTEYKKEPIMALTSGKDGLDAIINILHQAPNYLTSDGLLIAEVGENQELLCNTIDMPFMWIELEHGGEGVFVLSCKELNRYQDKLYQLIISRRE